MTGEPPIFLQPPVVMTVFMFGVIYFLTIRPQQQRDKEHKALLEKLDKNDEVITVGGVHATVVAVGDKTVTLRIADNVKIEIEKKSITTVTKKRE